MHRSAILAVLLLSICLLVSGCGGGSSNKTAVVSQIILSPTSLSLNSGDVGQIQAIPENSSNAQVTANITFSSSNSAIVTVSNAGLVCAGVWDSLTTPINCNGISGGNPVSGMATVTVTAPTGAVAGDRLVVHVASKSNPADAVVREGDSVAG